MVPSSLPPAFAQSHVAVVTNTASDIGLAACRRLAGLDMKMMLADLEKPTLHDAAKQVASLARGSQNVLTWPTDVRIPRDLVRLREATLERFGVASVLINNTDVGNNPNSP